jgi:hypothetical protein
MLNAVAVGMSGSRTGAPGQRRSGEEPNHKQGTQDDGQPRCRAGGEPHAVVSFALANASTPVHWGKRRPKLNLQRFLPSPA